MSDIARSRPATLCLRGCGRIAACIFGGAAFAGLFFVATEMFGMRPTGGILVVGPLLGIALAIGILTGLVEVCVGLSRWWGFTLTALLVGGLAITGSLGAIYALPGLFH